MYVDGHDRVTGHLTEATTAIMTELKNVCKNVDGGFDDRVDGQSFLWQQSRRQ